MENIALLLKPYVEALLGQYGPAFQVAATVIAVMGIARAIFKPLFVFLHEVALATPTPADDAVLDVVEKSAPYKIVVFLLDYVASIKLEKK